MGRWDYIFSYIKKFRAHPQFVLPDRASVTMTSPFLANYVRLLIATCHRRGVHAMGGMAAFIPVANDAAANQLANDKVKADKLREVTLGCDGTWVAHPALIPIARAIFDEHMKTPNQITRKPDAVLIRAADLLGDATAMVQQAGITADGVRGNIDVGLAYTEAWLRGLGCVPLHNMMEDAATAEIARCQIWQWIRHRARTKEGILISKEWVKQELDKHVEQVKKALGAEVSTRTHTRHTHEGQAARGPCAMRLRLTRYLCSPRVCVCVWVSVLLQAPIPFGRAVVRANASVGQA
jgi:malate synthase